MKRWRSASSRQSVKSSSNWSATRRMRALAGRPARAWRTVRSSVRGSASRSRRTEAADSPARVPRREASSARGWAPGVKRRTSQSPLPGRAPFSQPRYETRAHERGLPAAAGPDDGEEAVRPEPPQEGADHLVAAKVEAAVGRLEGAQAHVRTGGVQDRLWFAAALVQAGDQLGDEARAALGLAVDALGEARG